MAGEPQARGAGLVQRRAEGPARQPKKGRLWLNDGSCIRLRPEHRDHVWACDFVEDRTHDGRKTRMLNVVDEFTRECLAVRVARKLKAIDVIDVLSDLFMPHAACRAVSAPTTAPSSSRSPCRTGSALSGQRPRTSHRAVRGRTATSSRSTPGSGMELLDGEIFTSLREAEVIIESWRNHCNTARPHGSIGCKPPTPEVYRPSLNAGLAAQPRPAPPAVLMVAPRPTMN